MDDTIEETFYLVSKPHSIRVEGFPMNSLSVDVQSGKYFVDLTDEERASAYSVVMASGISSAKQSVNMLIC